MHHSYEVMNGQQADFSIEYARLIFVLRAKREARLPAYIGSTLRGALGQVFRRNTCMTGQKTCQDCMFASQCAYAYIFETSQESVKEKIGQQYIPHPFLIEPPLDGKTSYQQGEELEFRLLLIGRGIDFLAFFIAAFSQAALEGLGAGRYPFELLRVEQIQAAGRQIIWSGGNKLQHSALTEHISPGMEAQNYGIDTISVRLNTPTRLMKQGELIEKLEFEVLMRNILRRLDILGRAHGTGALSLPYREILNAAARVKVIAEGSRIVWEDWQRYSNRQKTTLFMGGMLGTIRYQGDLEIFMPYLRMAQVFHVGKGTVFGLGSMSIIS